MVPCFQSPQMSPCFTACVTKVTKAGTCALWPNSIRSTPHHLRLEMAAMKTLQTPLWQTSFAAKKSTKGMSISQSRCSVNEASHFPTREKKVLWLASRFKKSTKMCFGIFKKIAIAPNHQTCFSLKDGPFVVLSESQSLAGSTNKSEASSSSPGGKTCFTGSCSGHLEKFQAKVAVAVPPLCSFDRTSITTCWDIPGSARTLQDE